MKKYISAAVAGFLGFLAINALALETRDVSTFSGSGTTLNVVIPAQAGKPVAASMAINMATGATVVVQRPDRKTTLNAAASAATNIQLRTDTAGKVAGAVPTTSDILVVQTTAGAAYRAIASVTTNGVHTNSYINVGVASTTADSGATVFIGIDGKKLSLPIASGAQYLLTPFSGFNDNPVVIQVPAGAGSTTVGGTINWME